MSLKIIPWQSYVLIVGVAALITLFYVKQAYRNFPKTFLLGLVLVSVGAILASFLRLIENIPNPNENRQVMQIVTASVVSFGIPLILFGAYVKVKDDPERRKLMLILIGVFFLVIVLTSVLVVIKLLF